MRHVGKHVAGDGGESEDRGEDTPDQDHRHGDELGEALHALEAEIGVDDHHHGKQRGDGAHRRHGHQAAGDVDDELHREQVEGHAVDDQKQRDEAAADGAENAARHNRMGLAGGGARIGRADAIEAHDRSCDQHRHSELGERQALEARAIADQHGAEHRLHREELRQHAEVRAPLFLRHHGFGVVCNVRFGDGQDGLDAVGDRRLRLARQFLPGRSRCLQGHLSIPFARCSPGRHASPSLPYGSINGTDAMSPCLTMKPALTAFNAQRSNAMH